MNRWLEGGLTALVLLLATTRLDADPVLKTTGSFHAISVANLERSVAWYTTHLGFALKSSAGNEQRKGALLVRDGTLIEVAEFAAALPRESLREGLASHELIGIFKLGFLVKDLDGSFERLEASGVEIFFPIVAASDDQRTFGIRDPDGNIVQFFGP